MTDTLLTTAENAVQIPGVRATRIGLEIDESLTPEAASTVFACLEHITGCSNWLWGDALAFAQRQWGNQYVSSKYKAASEATALAIPTLKLAKFTAERIPMARRRRELTFTHHAEIAHAFPDEAEQDRWLDRAIAEEMTAIALRKAIRVSKQEIFEEPNKEAGKYKPVEALMTLVDWFRKQDPAQWPDEQREAWRDDLEPIVEFFHQL